jgi:competence protein ComEC
MALFAAAIGWAAGIALGQWLGFSPLAIVLLMPLPAAAAILAYRQQRVMFLAALAIMGLLAGLTRMEAAPLDQRDLALRPLIESEASLTGLVRGEAVSRAGLWRVHLDVEHAETDDGSILDLSGGAVAWVAAGDAEALAPGDRVRLSGRLALPPTFPDFDYRTVLEERGVSVALYRPQVELLQPASGPSRWLFSVRRALGDSLERALPEPEAGLARAVLLDQREGLTPQLQDQWARAGTAHIIAISGLHITVLLGVSLAAGTALLGRRWGLHLLLALAAIWAYALLAGFGAPVQRAAFMGSLYLLAAGAGRQSSGGLALVLAASVIAGVDPEALGEPSFQLTFGSMAGLVYLSAPIASALQRLIRQPEGQSGFLQFLITSIAASLSATLGILLLLAYHFGAVSLMSVPSTLLAVPALPLMLLSGALAATVGLLGDLPGQIAGWLAWPSLAYPILLSSGFAALPFAAVAVGPFSSAETVLAYILIGLMAWRFAFRQPAGLLGPAVLGPSASHRPYEGVMVASPSLLAVAVLVGLPVWAAVLAPSFQSEGLLRVAFLDVGQGDAVLIQSPGGRRVLVDGGPDPRVLERRLAEELPWWSPRIDLVVLTHPNLDHVGGLIDLVARRPVGAVLDPLLPAETDVAQRWRQAVATSGVTAIRAVEGTRIDLGDGAWLEALHPPDRPLKGTPSDLDNNSIVLRLTYGRATFLLTGDVFALAEQYLIESGESLGAVVFKAAHHGSANANTEAFLEAVQPLVAVASAGLDNPFGHPHPEALERIAAQVGEGRVFRTDREGTVRFTTNGQTLWTETARGYDAARLRASAR